jgi:dimethylaniline monooxygenase (N-oxide forming)
VATARVLLAEGFQCSLLEKTKTLGGVWADNYAGFGIQVPSRLYEFPDEPLPAGWDYASGDSINKYIHEYAEKHGVNQIARLGCSVEGLAQHGDMWQVDVKDSNDMCQTLSFDHIVIATGVYSSTSKYIPQYEGADSFEGTWLHSVDFKDVHLCANKNVVIVGYGKSAFDCAQFSSKVSSKSTLLFREAHWPVPRKILGLVPFEYATFSRFGAGCLLPAYPKQGPMERIVHAFPGLLDGFWWLVSKIFSWQFRLNGKPNLVPSQGFIQDFWGGHGVIPHPDFFPMVRNGSISAKKGCIQKVKPNSLVLESGEEIPADVVLFGTGFKQNLDFLPENVRACKEEDGLWLYRQMVHPDFPSLFFVNSNTTTFTNITTASIQARWLAETLKYGLPSKEDMWAEIKEKQTWKRETMPNAGAARSYMMQTHQVHYYDELLQDMGASVCRKRGLFASFREFFEPYRPRDYDTIMTGAFKTEQKPSSKSWWASLFLSTRSQAAKPCRVEIGASDGHIERLEERTKLER